MKKVRPSSFIATKQRMSPNVLTSCKTSAVGRIVTAILRWPTVSPAPIAPSALYGISRALTYNGCHGSDHATYYVNQRLFPKKRADAASFAASKRDARQ